MPDPGLGYVKDLEKVSPFFLGYFIGALGPIFCGRSEY
jgi:hypothetical protein